MYLQSICNTLGKCGLAHVTKRETKTVFWRIGFHMCADRPRKHWRKSSRRRGFWRYCDCYCETAHWLVWTDSMKEREREWFWREGKAGVEGRSLSENSRSLLPPLSIQILDIFGHFASPLLFSRISFHGTRAHDKFLMSASKKKEIRDRNSFYRFLQPQCLNKLFLEEIYRGASRTCHSNLFWWRLNNFNSLLGFLWTCCLCTLIK